MLGVGCHDEGRRKPEARNQNAYSISGLKKPERQMWYNTPCEAIRASYIKVSTPRNFLELSVVEIEMTLDRHSRSAHGQLMTDPTAAGDDTLLLRIKAGDEDAFIELYRNRQRAVYSFALQMSGSRSVAEDVTQEVFLALMREVATFNPARGTVSGYLYGMTRNMVLDHLKRGRLDVSLTEAAAEDGRTVPRQLIASGDPLGDLTRGEAVESLRTAILALPEHYREVVVLCDLHEMDYARAAQVLKCAVGTVRSRLHRARELLLNKMGARRAGKDRVSNLKPLRCAL